ncbi:E3 ubiquitin-protein ligase RDUF1-like [Mercurialis annua]|uniref:E3 ubiquitin-protein ligase RDUF1-like n=1 Tax=Mercurialis annua TaxID=3986 RepID=UPI00216050F3|nr:E3 ubiquitin-protein ligase RDUF1-like [Mercurialis annua]
MSSPASTTSYWCHRCTRFISVLSSSDEIVNISCPHCEDGFIEEMDASNSQSDNPHRRFLYMLSDQNNTRPTTQPDSSDRVPTLRFRRNRRNTGDRSPFNPVIVLRGATGAASPEEESNSDNNSYEFYYDDGSGSGLRPVPASMSEFLMGSGFDRLLEQLTQVELNGFGRVGNPPASKAVVESMPFVEVTDSHAAADLHCAVCKEAFEVGCEAREMPCKHIYHSDCILPWLALRNSCPVCRFEMPADEEISDGNDTSNINSNNDGSNSNNNNTSEESEEIVGLTIWRLPGGGFAVGRFSGGRRGGEREFPGVFTEMDGGFSGGNGGSNGGNAPRRISWASRASRGRENSSSGGGGRNGFTRAFRGLVSFVRRIGSGSGSRSSSSLSRRRRNNNSTISSPSLSLRPDSEMGSISRSSSSHSSSGFGRYVSRRRRGLDLEVENGTDRW